MEKQIKYAIFTETMVDGFCLSEARDGGLPVLYDTAQEAANEWADCLMHQLEQVKAGERDPDDVNTDEWIEPVAVMPDGEILSAVGRPLGHINKALPGRG